ncbi:MAG: hypothetical protein ACOC8K_09860 [Gemmatimonadota bacterium]
MNPRRVTRTRTRMRVRPRERIRSLPCLLLLLVSPLALPAPGQAQDAGGPVGIFVTTGAGFGTHFTPHASVAVAHPTGDYILRGALGYRPDVGDSGPWGGPRELAEIAVIYGRRMQWDRGWLRAGLGVSYVGGDQLEPVLPGEEPTAGAVGLAAQVGVAWVLTPAVGIGLAGIGDLNDFRSLGAVTVTLHVGSLR